MRPYESRSGTSHRLRGLARGVSCARDRLVFIGPCIRQFLLSSATSLATSLWMPTSLTPNRALVSERVRNHAAIDVEVPAAK